MQIPSISQCLQIMEQEAMLPNIRAHSLMVARVAHCMFLALQNTTNTQLPPEELVIAGALLHDIAKTPCIARGCHHAKKGRDLCDKLGFPEVGEIVREHVWLFDFSLERYQRCDFFAKELVYYADKRVRHDRIVSLAARKEYIIERYGNDDPKRFRLIDENFSNCAELEKYLFACIDSTPQNLESMVDTHALPGI